MTWKTTGADPEALYNGTEFPSLDLKFADNKTLVDEVSGDNLITFTRSSIGTYVDANGVIQTASTDTPRFDHDPVTGESLGLLIEESRTNLLTYSANLTSSEGWSNVSVSNMSATNVSITAPDATETVTQLTGGGLNSWWAKPINATTSTLYQVSMWVKVADGGSDFNAQLLFYAPGATNQALLQGTTWNITSSWKRVTAYVTSGSSFAGSFNRFIVIKLDTTRSFYAWGAQVEAGSFPTSYIPTSGSTVTRAADVAEITGSNFSSWFNQSEGTVFTDVASKGVTGVDAVFAIGSPIDSNSDKDRWLQQYFAGSHVWYEYEQGSPPAHPYTVGTFIKSAIGRSQGDNAVGLSGAIVQTDSYSGAYTPIFLKIGVSGNPDRTLNGHIARLTYYPYRLSDTRLQTITT